MTKDRMAIEMFLDKVRVGRKEWQALLGQIPSQQMVAPGAAGHWAVKDVIAHITWHEREMVGLLKGRTLRDGSELWLQPLDQRNAVIYEQNKNRSLVDVLNEALTIGPELLNLLSGLTTDELNDPSCFEDMPGDWVPWHVIASNTYGHYEQHTAEIKEWIVMTSRAGASG